MTVRLVVSEPELAAGLAFFLRRHDCEATAGPGGTVNVELPHQFHDEQARLELELYIRLWQTLHGVTVQQLLDRAEPT